MSKRISRISEAETRYNLIDGFLREAGWDLNNRAEVGFEVPVKNYDTAPLQGITDYCLYRDNGEVLAVVEAKRTQRDARVGKEQVLNYVREIALNQSFTPFAFLCNGQDTYFWDTEEYAERFVAGFFSKANLERLLYLKKNRQPLSTIPINSSIINRAYQVEAIRRIGEAIEQKKKRKALLVMATGTGKTRTIMALADVLLRARQAQRILFLADRDTLVNQALNEGFKVYLPHESRERLESLLMNNPDERDRVSGARILVSTLQTLEIHYNKFSPADFDVVITDECHRSIYNKYSDVLAYFDALHIGLTATPANFIDRDTFRFFECDGNAPTFLYEYEQAVNDGYLAPYNVYAALTHFQRKGIKGMELSEENQNILRAHAIDPENINFEGTDIEKKVTNKDTLSHQWAEFMENCYWDAATQLPAKTIIFAITQAHAYRLATRFQEMYPDYQGLLCAVITSDNSEAAQTLKKFKTEDLPRIAISVDMLDTGVDVPEVMNLAFMKPVGSRIKFWQMIGRGTRSMEACKHLQWLPAYTKDNFRILDFWQNFEHFEMLPASEDVPPQIPVLTTIFNTRLKKIELLLQQQHSADAQRIIHELRSSVQSIPLDSYTVRKQRIEMSEALADEFWLYLTPKNIEFLRLKIAPLLRFVQGVNLPEAFFTSKMERCGLQLLQGADTGNSIQSIRSDVRALLSSNVTAVQKHKERIHSILGGQWWQKATLATLDEARTILAPLMRYKEEFTPSPMELDLRDIIDSRQWIVVQPGGEKIMTEEYRRTVEEKILHLAQTHPTLQRLQQGETVGIEELIRLEESIVRHLEAGGIQLTEDNILKAFGVRVGALTDFLKHILKLEQLPTYEHIVRRAFDAFILEHHYNADQTRFLRTVQSVFVQRRSIEEPDLYEAPFSNFGHNAVEKLFSKKDVEELLQLTQQLGG